MALNRHSISELIPLLKNGEISPLDVARDVADAVDKGDGDISAYLGFDTEVVLAEAKKLTESGEYRSKPLCGVPIAIKDNICVKGERTTAASRILENYRSPYNATVVERLRTNGAVIAGKTNLDEFAMGSSTENSAYKPSRNPWNTDHAPGGSSGGSAAAVAADLAIAALGSDTGGSIRQPASFCGVAGMKPTYGRVSRYGLLAFASSLDQIGPLTKTVADSAILLNAISGPDKQDSTSLRATSPDYTASLGADVKGLRVGVPWDFLGVGMDAEVEKNFKDTVALLEASGASVSEVSLPHSKFAVACYYIIANAEASSNLARYDGVKYGHRTSRVDDVYTMYTRTRDEGFGEEVKRRILLGTYVLSAGYYDAYYKKAQQVRSLVIRDFAKAFESCDVVMMPTSPSTAFKIGERVSDPLAMYLADVFTIPVSLAGLPGISIPTGLSSEKLPFGVQFIGAALAEATVIRTAAAVEERIGFKRSIGD